MSWPKKHFPVPISLLLEQGPMLKTLARILWKSVLPAAGKPANPVCFPDVRRQLPAPSRRLIRHYAAWCKAPQDRYTNTLPPHLFTQFALPVWAVQLEMTRYRLSRIINQGCGITIHGNIPAGRPLDVHSRMISIVEKDNRARIHQQLAVGTVSAADAMKVDFYATFILGKRKREKPVFKETFQLASVASWDAMADDGFQFGILTGDLNPIHWNSRVARRSAFGGTVMQGFGMFARSFETLQTATDETIQSIDVRFVRPVRLPSHGLQVLRSPAAGQSGGRKLVLRNRQGQTLMAGSYIAGKKP